LILTPNSWNDYGYQVMFDLAATRGGRVYQLGALKLLIQGEVNSNKVLEEHLARRSRTTDAAVTFPLPRRYRYISLASSLDVYRRLSKLFSRERALEALGVLHDAAILEAVDPDSELLHLRREEGFKVALQRSTSEEQAIVEAAACFDLVRQKRRPSRFTLTYQLNGFSSPHKIEFSLRRAPLHSRLTVLIGKNGVGKTQALETMAEYLLGVRRGESTAVDELAFEPLRPRPLFSQVVALSYGAFDHFPPEAIANRGSYRKDLPYVYCGFKTPTRRFNTKAAHGHRPSPRACVLSA
jgi:hypothetical protein